MTPKMTIQNRIPLLIGLLLAGTIVIFGLVLSRTPALQMALDLSADRPVTANAETFDYEQAAEISAMRWQAMARFYEDQGMLTRDNFDYEQAADNQAFRWQAMARYYEQAGLLNDRMAPGDVMAYRWQAMARAYERMGMLNSK